MSKIPFNVDASTARLIGRENVAKLNGAIIELVKNTYDADAKVCILYYEAATNSLYIADNGSGMSEDVITDNWMTIGRSTKTTNFKSNSGRVQTGAKGIGRFALDRISDTCAMYTLSEAGKLIWEVEWEDFSKSKNITDVTAELYVPPISIDDFLEEVNNDEVKKFLLKKIKKSGTGTIFKLTNLRDVWDKSTIGKIKEDLTTLIPYEMKNVFQVYFFDEETALNDAEVLSATDDFPYDYKIEFDVKEDGKTHIELHRNEFDFGDKFKEIMKGGGFTKQDEQYFNGEVIIIDTSFDKVLPNRELEIENTIGNFNGAFYFEKGGRNKQDLEKYFYKPLITNNKNNIFNGIKIYRDSFRVRPYGDLNTPNYDWLLLSNRRNESPAAPSHPTGKWRVNANQVIGSVLISRLNRNLEDQSNREGIIENREFVLLKEFLLKIIGELERDRQYVFRKLRKLYDDTHEHEKIQIEINEKAEESRMDKERNKNSNLDTSQSTENFIDPERAKIALDNKDSQIKDLEDENRLLRTLATTGIVTNTYIHEIKDITHKLSLNIIMAKNALDADQDLNAGLEYIEEANKKRESLSSWFKVTLGSISRDKRTQNKTNLNHLISKIVSSWKAVLPDIDIDLCFSNNEIELKCFPYDIESILTNLIANSVNMFQFNYIKEKKINIKILDSKNDITIIYCDSGKGLPPAYRETPRKILEPMESDKKNDSGETIGTGMGMWIIDKTVSEYDGSIDLSENMKHAFGFYITIKLTKK